MNGVACVAHESLIAEGQRLLAARHLAEAIHRLRLAEAAGADADRCASGRWMAHMLRGNYERAWQESDAIRTRALPDPHRLWQGESLSGKSVVLRCLHGFGDAVQMLRYVPRLRAIASHVIVEVPPRMLRFVRRFDGVDEVITWGPQAPARSPQWEVQIEVMELPYIFRTQLSDLPLAANYLHLPQSQGPETNPSSQFKVGLEWSAGSWNASRAIPFDLLKPLFTVDGCEFWNLQGGPESQHAESLYSPYLHEDASCRDSIEGLATTIAKLDLVITVDTLAAHLAGSLGVSTWLMLQHEADWRWMHARDDSPWYPSLRLFRQSVPGDWAGVIASVCDALRAQTGAPPHRQVA